MWDCDDVAAAVRDDEQRRYVMARLLRARGEQVAASIVAVSTYQAVLVDNWDGGQYEVILSVPPELYDEAREATVFEALDAVACDLVTSNHYRGLSIALKLSETRAGWVAEILNQMKPRWVKSEQVVEAELVAGDS